MVDLPIAEPAVSPRPLPSSDKLYELDRPEAGNNLGPYSWPARYFRRQYISFEWENFPWIRRNETGTHGENDMSYFFIIDEDARQDQCRIDSILDICHDATLERLQKGTEPLPREKIALLVDSRIENDKAKFRPWRGALSSRQLLQALLEEVFLVPEQTRTSTVSRIWLTSNSG